MSVGAEMAQAADSWLSSLSADQRAQARYPGPGDGDAERTTWFYTPTDHGGLPLGQQRPRQQGLAMRLLATGLSLAGYAVVATVMGLENVLDRVELWSRDWGRERGRDPGLYYFRVFGSPGDGAWGWRCGGHHVSLNYTIADGRVASCTPCFIGAHPAETALLAGGTLKPLGNIEPIARDLARDLEQRGQREGLLHPSAISDIVSGNRAQVRDGDEMIHMPDLWRGRFAEDRLSSLLDQIDADAEAASGYGPPDHRALALTTRPKGIKGGALSQGERARLLELVAGYLGRFPAEIADPWLADYRAGGLDNLYFAYTGERASHGPVYYRLQDQRLLVEYDNTQYGANHAHSVVRDLSADFGIDPLARHWRDSHAGLHQLAMGLFWIYFIPPNRGLLTIDSVSAAGQEATIRSPLSAIPEG
jgi:Protein of unknown function (DUF3500)